MSDSPGVVDFAIGLVISVFNLPDGQVMFLGNSNNRRTVKSILRVKKLLGLVEMTSGLVMASCKNDFLCNLYNHRLVGYIPLYSPLILKVSFQS